MAIRFPVRVVAADIIRILGSERRRAVGEWRIEVLARRIAIRDGLPIPDRRRTQQLLRALLATGDVRPVEDVPDVFVVSAPFASVVPVSQELILQEAHPWAVFSFATALAYHDLTNVVPKSIYATQFGSWGWSDLPVGTTPEDWIEDSMPAIGRPSTVQGVPVDWTLSKATLGFGVSLGLSEGLPVRVTTLERTVLDAIRNPAKCYGIAESLRAWRAAAPRWNIEVLLDLTERFTSPLMCQRVGVLVEALQQHHPRLDGWATRAQRGGSMRLVTSEPYAPTYSERWCLSLNVPPPIWAEFLSDE